MGSVAAGLTERGDVNSERLRKLVGGNVMMAEDIQYSASNVATSERLYPELERRLAQRKKPDLLIARRKTKVRRFSAKLPV